MKLLIIKDCPHPSNNKKTWIKGVEVEVINELGRELVKGGFAEMIPRTSEEWEVKEKLGKQVLKRKSKKETKENEG